jgi:hypothetical protein
VGFQLCYALFDGVQAVEGFAAVFFDVGMQHF